MIFPSGQFRLDGVVLFYEIVAFAYKEAVLRVFCRKRAKNYQKSKFSKLKINCQKSQQNFSKNLLQKCGNSKIRNLILLNNCQTDNLDQMPLLILFSSSGNDAFLWMKDLQNKCLLLP